PARRLPRRGRRHADRDADGVRRRDALEDAARLRRAVLIPAPGRIMLAAFGDPGHAFPAIALGRELVRRGHTVAIETWQRWREDCEREGMEFAAAPEYEV